MSVHRLGNSGFTLIELLAVIAVLGVLAAVSVPAYNAYIKKGNAAADTYSLGVLNEATYVYYASNPSPNLFEAGGLSDGGLMQVLVDESLIPEKPIPKLSSNLFVWYASDKRWLLLHELAETEITLGTGGFSGFITGSFSGSATDLTIPKSIDGEEVTAIYQDVFSGKGLASVVFPTDSVITRIHARAFKDNKLTELVLPASITRIDYGAFMGNNITKVTIGSGVYLEGSVFQNSDSFETAYEALGAGTYIYSSGTWAKQ
ncbi:MAG: leucine-rich repeat protein [Oscillospiraceae bacterium]|nr:leucine-rich repeat protein [Oscillospiraceae bacterium]